MGLAISVVAFQGLDRAQVMERAKLAEGRGRRREAWWLGEVDGWTILWGECGYATAERLAAFSRGARVVGVEIEEHVMVSGAAEFRDGARVWMMAHDPETDVEGVDVAGEPPEGFAAVLAELERQQRDDEDAGLVDFIFEAPPEAARLVTGYRHDELHPEDDPRFVAVHVAGYDGHDAPREMARAPKAPKPPPRPPAPEELWPLRLARLAVIPALGIVSLGLWNLRYAHGDFAEFVILAGLTALGAFAARHVWRHGSRLAAILLGLPPLLMAVGELLRLVGPSPAPIQLWVFPLAAVSAVSIYGAVRLDDVRHALRLD